MYLSHEYDNIMIGLLTFLDRYLNKCRGSNVKVVPVAFRLKQMEKGT